MTIENAIDILASEIATDTEEQNEALDFAIDVMRKTKWTPVTERLPDPYTAVLVSAGKYVWIDSLEDDFDSSGNYVVWWDSYNFVDFDKTAWMPIPEPFKGGE